MAPNKLKALLAGDIPRLVVSFSDDASDDDLAVVRNGGVDVAELRIDRYSSYQMEHVVSQARRFTATPTIATIRTQEEGGSWHGSDSYRIDLFEALLDHVDAVDVELSSIAVLPEVAARAKGSDRTLIVSHHDFAVTPPRPKLDAIMAAAREAGADLVKIAVMAHTSDDVRRLAQLTLDNAASGVVIIAMGAHGVVSRVFFPALGSRLTFAHLGKHPVPGQLHFTETIGLLRKFYPDMTQDSSTSKRAEP